MATGQPMPYLLEAPDEAIATFIELLDERERSNA